jgi:Amt family ammonium transporter
MKKILILLVLFNLMIVGSVFAEEQNTEMAGGLVQQTRALPSKVDTGDTTWVLISTALVMLMTPGLALFYGGMVRRKNVLGTIMQSFVALGVITIQWVLYGYSLSLVLTLAM